MSTDAQAAETEINEAQVSQEEVVNPESSAGLGENQENKQDGVQKRINQLTAEKYQERREKEELQKRIADLESKTSQPAAQNEDLKAPSLPEDMYDEEAMRKYHSDMIEYNQKAAQLAASSAYENRVKQEADKQSQSKQSEIVGQYAQNAIRDGVDLEKLRAAEQALNQAGISDSLGAYIMQDSNGGKIVEYLHDNPALMHEVLSLDPVSAGIKIATEVKPQALSTTPKVSNAPEPTPDLNGGGFVDKDDFERQYPDTEFI